MTDVYTELLQENSELKTKIFRLEQENKELKEAYDEISNNSEILRENNSLRIANAKLSEDLWQHGISMREWREQSIRYRSAFEEINTLIDKLDGLECVYGDYNCDNCSSLVEENVCTYKLHKIIKDKINEVLE